MVDLAERARRLNHLRVEIEIAEASLRAVKITDSWQHVIGIKRRLDGLRSDLKFLERRCK